MRWPQLLNTTSHSAVTFSTQELCLGRWLRPTLTPWLQTMWSAVVWIWACPVSPSESTAIQSRACLKTSTWTASSFQSSASRRESSQFNMTTKFLLWSTCICVFRSWISGLSLSVAPQGSLPPWWSPWRVQVHAPAGLRTVLRGCAAKREDAHRAYQRVQTRLWGRAQPSGSHPVPNPHLLHPLSCRHRSGRSLRVG